ncbi:MerR family transcriptional regulator [Nonomuraea endophytica]|uniref:DNA-binding transcriptional MerR regulator n=1 Tax=Nonomuraea endophytica TaxID=714136 RepID=A0A7W8A4S6_9ACTN|nr:MerR family transcriptional regulator [Nonomuraea endophytica]MBB5079528.1 DNA-binding transcriptional MerR regulator [Nonomuraea endophytica]
MRIGELAARSGVSVRALRYYEEQGLLKADRSESGQRHYPASAADRVELIQTLYSAGLSSRTVAELLPCVDAKVSTPESRARLAAERDRINAQIAALARTRDNLDAVIASTGSPASGCAVIADHDVAARPGSGSTSRTRSVTPKTSAHYQGSTN